MVSSITAKHQQTVIHPSKELHLSTTRQKQETSHKHYMAECFHLIREKLTTKGLSTVATDIILQSWRKSTGQLYGTYFGKWMLFSETEQVNPFDPPTETVLAFLSSLYEKNIGYSAINTAKSAISSICSVVSNRDIGNEKIITRFMRGIFNSRPSLPKYTETWDVNIVFKYLDTLSTVPKDCYFVNVTEWAMMPNCAFNQTRQYTY